MKNEREGKIKKGSKKGDERKRRECVCGRETPPNLPPPPKNGPKWPK